MEYVFVILLTLSLYCLCLCKYGFKYLNYIDVSTQISELKKISVSYFEALYMFIDLCGQCRVTEIT